MKKLVFNLILIVALCVSMQSCNMSGKAYGRGLDKGESVQLNVKYTIVDKGAQYRTFAYTTSFVWWVVVYDGRSYQVKEVTPEFYYKHHVGDHVIFK